MEGGNYWKVKPLQKLRLKMKVMEIEKKKNAERKQEFDENNEKMQF